MYIILVYDIMDDPNDPASHRILNKVFKTCKKFLHHVQKSVFEGELTISNFETLKITLIKLLRQDKDSVIIFKSRQEKWLEKEFFGKEAKETFNII